jgi:hypothetical protein
LLHHLLLSLSPGDAFIYSPWIVWANNSYHAFCL